jgi:hypothetical protein
VRSPGTLGAGLAAALFLAALPSRARAQGVVLSRKGRPLPVKRIRALLVFQERAELAHHVNEPNRQDLLVELELARPAPAGALWAVAAPREGLGLMPGRSRVLEELAGHWRRGAEVLAGEPWPGKEASAPAAFGKQMDLAGFKQLLVDRGAKLDPDTASLLEAEEMAGRAFFAAEVPAGARRLGPVHIRGHSRAARYPGALGARRGADGRWSLPPMELMLLHSHFINVADNPWGLRDTLGLRKRYQDEGTLEKGKPLWAVPPPKRGRPLEPGTLSVRGLPAVAEFAGSLGAAGSLFLTVVEGQPARAERPELDFQIYSHYPSAVEPTSRWTGLIALGASMVVLVVLARFLFKRKGLVQ